MADRISMVSADNARSIIYDLELDGVGADLTGTTIECHMRDRNTGDVAVVTDVVAAVDQSATPGRCTTTFTAAELLTGVYTLEWEVVDGVAITTYPGRSSDRPVLTVRSEAD